MRRTPLFVAGVLVLLALVTAPVAMAQVTGLYYKEVVKDGSVYVFNTPERFQSWSQSADMGKAVVTLPGRGANGENLVGENETAIDLYLFKHNLDAYDRPTKGKAAGAGGAFPNTKIGIRVFADISDKENKDKGAGTKSSDSGTGVDVKRTYFTLTQDFDAVWSAVFQSDIGDQGTKRYDVFVKNAYIQAKASPGGEATFRLGAAPMPWIPYVENLYGFRYIETTLTDHLSFANSADWGLHFLGKAGIVNYQLSAVNGRGYSNPARSKDVDYEGRIGIEPVQGFNLAVGGYTGKRGLETDALPAFHTATRTDAAIGYVSDRFRIGGEWFSATNWNRVTTNGPEDKSDGTSVWASFGFNDTFSILGRYDQAKPSKDLNPDLKTTYYNLGLQLRANKTFAAALVYKFEQVQGGTFSTSNGTIGSTKLLVNDKGEYNEIGIFAIYDF